MITLSKQQTDAAQEFATATIEALKVQQGVHPGTVVAATARMAGTVGEAIIKSMRIFGQLSEALADEKEIIWGKTRDHSHEKY